MPGADAAFEQLAERTIDDILSRRPELASSLGDHRFDHLLTDLRPEALESDRRSWRLRLAELEAVDTQALRPDNAIDAAILVGRLQALLLELEDLRETAWNPLIYNPGDAIYVLLARDYAPLPVRLEALASRLAAIPGRLSAARDALSTMPRVHTETALSQFEGTLALVTQEVDDALEQAPAASRSMAKTRPDAVAALEDYRRWLAEQMDRSDRDPRIGADLFAQKLRLTLDTTATPDAVRQRAASSLDRIEDAMARTAAQIDPGAPVRDVLDRLATDRPSDATIVTAAADALERTTSFVQEHGLLTLHDDPLEIRVMPEFRRGVAVAYCDSPGPLETGPGQTGKLPTFFAVSPTPRDWTPERVESFYREYNAHMVHDLTIHEAMPGHHVQLSHGRRSSTPTRVRAAFRSGPFVEGWAVYAEDLMAAHGYGGPEVAMQQLKMALRSTINALLDHGVHCAGMREEEAMALMTGRGYQEEGEAAGKWRRALLTSTQLSTYFVGQAEVTDAVRDLRRARPGCGERDLHDELLSHGSPPTRHLRALLGFGQAGV